MHRKQTSMAGTSLLAQQHITASPASLKQCCSASRPGWHAFGSLPVPAGSICARHAVCTLWGGPPARGGTRPVPAVSWIH